MLLNELFDKPNKWQWVNQSNTNATALFQVGEVLYQFDAALTWGQTDSNDNPIPDTWHLSFEPVEGSEIDPEREYGEQYGKTGTGNEQLVFTTVVDIIKDFMKQYSPHHIGMTAEEPNRRTLYLRMFKRLLPNWDVSINRDHIIASIRGK